VEGGKSGVSMAIPHDERDLEAELHRFYLEGGKLNPPYWARRFYQLFTRGCVRYVGGVEAVRRMMATGGQSSGIEVVKKHGRLDLAVETLVLDSEWTHLFNDSDRWMAKRNLPQK
jgi:hypothetical protein